VRMFGPAVQTDAGARPACLMLPDRETLFPTEQLPLMRALRGEAVDDVEMFIQHPGSQHAASQQAASQQAASQQAASQRGIWTRITGRPLADARGQRLGGVIV